MTRTLRDAWGAGECLGALAEVAKRGAVPLIKDLFSLPGKFGGYLQRDTLNRSHRVVFFTKRRCTLCDEAREMLHHLGAEFPMEIQEKDIMTEASLYERYKYTVPVVTVDDEFTLEGRIEEKKLRRYLEGKSNR